MADLIVLQHLTDLDRFLRCIATITVNQQGNILANCLAYRRYQCFSSSFPLVLIVSTYASHPNFKGLVTVLISKPHQPLSLILRLYIPPHTRAINRK